MNRYAKDFTWTSKKWGKTSFRFRYSIRKAGMEQFTVKFTDDILSRDGSQKYTKFRILNIFNEKLTETQHLTDDIYAIIDEFRDTQSNLYTAVRFLKEKEKLQDSGSDGWKPILVRVNALVLLN